MKLWRCNQNDADAVHKLLCVPEVYHYLADGEAPDEAVAHAWVSGSVDPGAGLWKLCAARSDPPLGLVRLAVQDPRTLELIYLLHPAIWHRGWAIRMAHSAMDQAFQTGCVDMIWAGADAPNTASVNVMKRLGMTFRRQVQYPLHPGVEYEMKREDFAPKNDWVISVES